MNSMLRGALLLIVTGVAMGMMGWLGIVGPLGAILGVGLVGIELNRRLNVRDSMSTDRSVRTLNQ
jgi:hypothetical protein